MKRQLPSSGSLDRGDEPRCRLLKGLDARVPAGTEAVRRILVFEIKKMEFLNARRLSLFDHVSNPLSQVLDLRVKRPV